ncbi:hypothetical protein C4569_03865 [Candidatus Parcubacteria bacterium]|nr:MAG: hypothetical protein C4569_03865 [Candidatus Parcubacteria bacterium]
MKIGVYGSAARELTEAVRAKARQIGKAVAENNAILITGGCSGLPHEAAVACSQAGGKCIAFSPAVDIEGHQKIGFPSEGFSEFIFVPKDFHYSNNDLVCKKYRNVMSVAYIDAAIIISGRIGTMSEFTMAYDMGKTIGVLTGTGGITERAIKVLIEDAGKKTGAQVIFESNAKKLVDTVCKKSQCDINKKNESKRKI